MIKSNTFNKITVSALGACAVFFITVSCDCGKGRKIAVNEQASEAVAATAPVIAGKLDTLTNNFIYDTGELFTLKLPNGVEIPNVGKNSTEAKLFNFLSDPNAKVSEDKTQGWITLDRVYFDTGKAALTADSQNQIKNIGEILKVFPAAVIKLGGYTDNTGSAEANQRVSTERANIVQEELTKVGVEAGRISAEGYGPEHPVCPANDTKECQAENRRVDIRISQK